MKKQTKTKEKKKKGGIGKKIFFIILLLLIIGGTIFGYRWHKNGGGKSGLLATMLGHDEETVNNLPKMYCLLLGKSQNLTDTIMLASYDPKTQEAALLSIPRDTFVGEDRYNAPPEEKINAVYDWQGVDVLLEDVSEITGIDVEYYVLVDTEALRKLVDAIGGVEFDVPIDMDYDDYKQDLHIHLEEGLQVLDGDRAEQVVRFRHNNNGTTYPEEYGGEDLGRVRTQREFLTAIAEQTLIPENITKIPEFIEIAKEYVVTNLNFDIVKDYAPYAIEFDVDNLKKGTLPGVSEQAPGNGIWFYYVDEEEAQKTIDELFFNKTEDINSPEDEEGNISTEVDSEISSEEKEGINIEILNGTGLSTNLSEAETILESEGYNIAKTGVTSTTATTMIINRGEVSENIVNDIKNILKTGNISEGKENEEIDVTIILGTDYVM